MRTLALALTALLLVGCGDDEAPRDTTAKAAKHTGGEAPRAGGWAPSTAARPARSQDLVVRIFGRSPVGPIAPDHADEYAVEIELRNRSEDPILVTPAWVQLSVFRDALLVPGCSRSEPRELDVSDVIGPGRSVFTSTPLPCGLVEPGSYSVVAVLLTPERVEGAPLEPADARSSGTMRLVVDAALPPFTSVPRRPAPQERRAR